MHQSIYASYINHNTSIHINISIIYQWKHIDPSSSMHDIIYASYINDNTLIHLHLCMTLFINDFTWNPFIYNNDDTYFINILWQDIVPLTSILWHQWQHDLEISPFGIDGNTNIDVNTNHWWKHLDMVMLLINIHFSTSM